MQAIRIIYARLRDFIRRKLGRISSSGKNQCPVFSAVSCWSKQTEEMSGLVLNLEQVVRDWAWRRFEKRASKKDKKLLAKERKASDNNMGGSYIGLTIDWSEVQFVDKTVWSPLGPGESGVSGEGDASKGAPTVSVLFQTKFTNNTPQPQQYRMNTEKVTRSTCSTEIETCYTKGIEMGVTLKSPCEIFEANVGFKREVSLTNMHGETFEEELHWGVESEITVNKGSEAEASLVVDEKKQKGDFVVESQIWGMIYARFTKVRDNNILLLATGHNIGDIVEEYLEKQRRIGHAMDFVKVTDKAPEEEKTYDEKRVFVETRGRCNFRYGVKQEIKVNQTEIK